MNIIPLGDKIFVLPDEVVDKSKGGIILSDFSKKRPSSGTIIAVGEKQLNRKVGERVIYGEFSGDRRVISYNGEDKEIFVMVEEDLLALLI